MEVQRREPNRTSFTVPGLEGPVEIVIDSWGVPHIYATDTYDAFRAQGFNAARDRLWQIDFWRRRGLGRLSEVFGAEHVERDRAARLFLYRGDMRREWLSYGSDTKRASVAFVEGINAFVELTRRDPDLLPVEFRELGYEPALWEPEDVARIRSHGLFYNLRDEVTRARTLRDLPREVEELRRRREPERNLTIPDGLDLDVIPDDVLSVYDLATSAPAFGPSTPLDPQGDVLPEGSNNWVLAGSRTRSGRPLLANDPHRAAAALPGLRYIAHLSAPGFDVIGGGEPALPGISIGHNGRIAFGLTIFAIDQEDLYVYETNPDDPHSYWYQGRWEPMQRLTETIEVRDGEAVEAELLFTRHGPVIYQDDARHTAFAVRAAWLEPGMAPYLGSMDYMRSQNYDEFLAAMNRWGAPPENQVYADPAGTIAWKTGGLTPIRPNWDGTLPVPGDGRYEWAGFYDADQLPGAVDPERGFLATANECNLPEDFPADRHITYDWYAPSRRHRLDEVLAKTTDATPQSMVALQSDYLSVPARRIVNRLRELDVPADTDGLAMLLDWDGELAADSSAAALFEVWYRRHLRPALLSRAVEAHVGTEAASKTAQRISPAEDLLADARIDLELVEEPGDRLGPEPSKFLAATFASTLPAAVADLVGLLGPDRAQWSWGRLHVAQAKHPLAARLTGVPEDRLVAGPAPRGGSGDTVGNTAYGPNFVQSAGATFRLVVDVGEWDSSLAMNAPGQSGRLDDPHATDLFGPWSRDEAFPLLYSRERVDEAAEQVIRLDPSA
ncbi:MULTISPECIES: penicillin acylase family protein [unclassified Saccharopolyspora]|uniref:penicillin acylase family protein n=1 Tax=unclassified Saccharopolyspora TaxID=2646250 RepID=UPI001CD2BAE8|nr:MULTISPECIES: penicillin acylase family protein [unclassified Saccharopolyspora]MCA1186717.1 penicillin acylase family protein [Saccharopolyspora sp. 6T]MCA1278342.1 penicillin acylase family protein [Saccharopolyspora sp. 7B]